jgi:hypothetical protein
VTGALTITEHVNNEGERVAIVTPTLGDYKGQEVLVIIDDEDQGGTAAPMLFDESTARWLLRHILSRVVSPDMLAEIARLRRYSQGDDDGVIDDNAVMAVAQFFEEHMAVSWDHVLRRVAGRD